MTSLKKVDSIIGTKILSVGHVFVEITLLYDVVTFAPLIWIFKMKYLIVFLLCFIICCEFSDENLQGPPAAQDENKESSEDDEDTITKEFIASVEERDGATAIRIEPAPDLTNEKENVKGM